jgi:hypothetical protein
MSILSGCLPIKANLCPPADAELLPFHYLMPAIDDLPKFLQDIELPALWARFVDDFLSLPPLEVGVEEALSTLGVKPAAPPVNGAASKSQRVFCQTNGRR